ncbi:hypothetical protein [Bosea sp. (in: a-proteobacteria)]|uniref:hypothetical protein n=1 Tax=Bosea sp. (in: a-proteobacteria) TaxID=1871050 RepID=UPI002FCA3F39
MKKAILVAASIMTISTPALAGPTCSPGDDRAQILASATIGDVHPAWRGGKRVGYGWSLQVRRNAHDDAGITYHVGDLYDTRGKLSTRNVFAIDSEWDCGP